MPDGVNGLFELIGGLLILLSVRRVLIDRSVRGRVGLAHRVLHAVGLLELVLLPAPRAVAEFLWRDRGGGGEHVARRAAGVVQPEKGNCELTDDEKLLVERTVDRLTGDGDREALDYVGNWCMATDPENCVVCSRRPGHSGNHVAAGSKRIISRWPQTETREE